MSANDNKIIDVQEMLFKQMKRLDDNDYMEQKAANEIPRSNALTNTAMSFIKAINLQIRILESSEKSKKSYGSLFKELGVK